MTLADVEDKTGIPRDYVERLLLRTKRVGITDSFRGNAGGYRLAKKPKDISLWDIFSATGEDIGPWSPKPPKRSKRPLVCPVHPVWQKLYRQNREFFERTSLADFLN